jgi:hypothetical protein
MERESSMNPWTAKSIEIANKQDYLDKLLEVYPMNPESAREIDPQKWSIVEEYFRKENRLKLIETLLTFDLFPIKDSYIAYLKRDKNSLIRNSKTIDRIGNSLINMGLEKIKEKCSEPKETNRQIGPMFRNWINSNKLDLARTNDYKKFRSSKDNLILDLSDEGLMDFANKFLNYKGNKGLDLVAKIGNQYVVAEAKFLTDFGGHQNAQFNDAITLVDNKHVSAIKIALLDGVPYIDSNNKMSVFLRKNENRNIMSVLVLKDFLNQL